MIQLDAVSDALNKILDKAQQLAPTVWEAALRQVAINARMSFMWGIGWSVVGGIFLLIALGIPGLYVHERRKVKKINDTINTELTLTRQSGAMIPYNLQDSLSYFRNNMDPSEHLVATAWASIVAWLLVILSACMALSSFWNAWQMTQNPTWWAIQLLKP